MNDLRTLIAFCLFFSLYICLFANSSSYMAYLPFRSKVEGEVVSIRTY